MMIKQKLIFFNTNFKKFKLISNININLEGTPKIQIVDHCKYLGIMLDNKLSWKPHIDLLVKKLSNVLRMLYRIRYYLPKSALLAITHSLFISHINYGILCWGRAGKTIQDPIKILFNKLIRCINFQPYRYSNVNSLFLKDQILQVDDIFSLELGKFVYKFNNNQLPPVFDNYFKDLTEIHDHNTRGKEDNYFVERINSKMGSNTLKYRGVTLWKEIVASTKQSDSYSIFSLNYKKDLLRKYNNCPP